MLKRIFFILTLLLVIFDTTQAKWITVPDENVNNVNTWAAFRKDFKITKKPHSAKVNISVDSKYWLWINGRLAIFEGGLKRGPSPTSTYYDEIDIAKYLKKGKNKIALLVWYFGKNGFSHISSGKLGLNFSLNCNNITIDSDSSWLCRIHPAFGIASGPNPNYRLPESNICYNANLSIPDWQNMSSLNQYKFVNAKVIEEKDHEIWGNLVKRPIPQWKDFGIKYLNYERIKGEKKDSIIITLPYNMQMTPIFDITDNTKNDTIDITTNHTVSGGTTNLRAQYVTSIGKQKYESFGWLNGEKIFLIIPKNVTINKVGYRETGYNCEIEGKFECDDPFIMQFWKKALNTLYINMRDTFFDCPERERAQWWGDEVILQGECFYTLSTSVYDLMRKGINELCNWQRSDGSLFSPIPAGNYDAELPCQMLAAIGEYGFWNYYMNTGDKETIIKAYPHVKRYLELWKLDNDGLTIPRKTKWFWGDWGYNKDMRLILAGMHSLALMGAEKMAKQLNYNDDANNYHSQILRIKEGYNKCWNGSSYRYPSYKEETDDRVQALAVITGIASKDKFNSILNTFKTQFNASPYMEKYVMEALFKMGEGEYALERFKKRFENMVEYPYSTTLFEGWDTDKNAFGGGSSNHAWSGGAITVIGQYLCGIKPLEPGYKSFSINPQLANLNHIKISVPTIHGIIMSNIDNSSKIMKWNIVIPKGTVGYITLPTNNIKNISLNASKKKYSYSSDKNNNVLLKLNPGKYKINIRK